MTTWTSKEIAASTCHGTLTIGTTSMNTKAWASLNNYVLWKGAPRRGANSLIPGLAGRIPQPRRKDEATRTLEVLIIGDCNATGTPHANRSSGLAANWGTLESSILAWTGTGVTATLVRPNGVSRSGIVQIVDHDLGETGVEGALTLTLDLVLPYGELS